MSIVLDGVVLSGSMQWADRYEHAPVEQSVKRTLGGSLVVFHAPLIAGRPITLIATEDTGWLTLEMVEALMSRASAPGASYVLTIHDFTATVMFRHDDPPAVSFVPLTPKALAEQTDYFTGTAKFFTI